MASPIILPMNANQFGPNQVLNAVGDLDAAPPAPTAAAAYQPRAPIAAGTGVPTGYSLQGNWSGTTTTPVVGTALDIAWDRIRRMNGYVTDSRAVATFASDFRTVVLDRLRKIFIRLQTITARVQGQGGAAEALAQLVNAIVQNNGVTQQQAQDMQELSDHLSNLNIREELLGLMQVINNLSRQVGLVDPVGDNAGPANMQGGKKKKKKRKKGGYKFTRAAISRRSLRMKTRKLKSIKQKKPHHAKHKRTKHKRTKHKRRRKRSKRKH